MSSEIAKAYVQIMPSMQGIKGKLKAAMNDEAVTAGTSSGKTLGSSIASGLKSTAGAIAKVATAAVGAGTAAATALVKNAVGYYADYEQLVGGVETLFGSSSNMIKGYALEAYQTAGLTANEYMETTTSFAASLLQGLSGNTAKAAEYANTAVTDMADNANKMGSSMESIQNAYQGFSKQNYTMLDNLKLGYGGTKTEMERLLQDAMQLNGSFKLTRDSNDELVYSFADIVDAIHIVQEDMGITGTTALEASETISGSVATMKSSWKNLVGAMANGNADVGYFVGNFVESAETAAQNVLPAVETAIGGIGTLVQELGPKITAVLPELLTTVLPGMVSAGVSMLGAVGEGIVAAVPELVSVAREAVLEAAEDIFGAKAVEKATSTFSTAVDTVKTKFSEVKEAVQPCIDIISDYITSGELVNGVMGTMKPVFEATKDVVDILAEKFKVVKDTLQPYIDAVKDYITSGELANDVINAMETAFDTVSGVISGVVDGVKAFSDWCSEHQTTVEVMATLVGSLAAAIGLYEVGQIAMNVATTAWSTISGVATAATTVFSAAVAFLASPVTIAVAALAALIAIGVAIAKNWDSIKEVAKSVANAVGDFFHTLAETAAKIWETVKTTVSSAMDAIGTAISDGWNAAVTAISNALNAIRSAAANAWAVVTSTVSNAVNAVKNTVTTVFNAVKTTASSVWNGIKNTISTTANAIRTTVTTVWNAIKTAITTPITAAKNTVSSVFGSIQSTVSSKINAARDTVKAAIDRIKGFFNFSWSLPHLSLPHITISGSFSLRPPSVPKFGISWYAKAMDNPMLLDGATIFGAMGGNLLGGGEAGTEVVSGANTLMNMMRDVTRGELSGGFAQLERKIDQLLALLAHITGTTININGADYKSKMELAQVIIDIITREQKRQEYAYG